MTGNGRVLIYNPVSGSADHASAVLPRARGAGFDVRTTGGPGDGRRLAREAAADGASLIAVGGGDGTVNEVVHGLSDADAFDAVAVLVIPTGTANLFASSLGIADVDRAFEALERGSRERIDVGYADERPFVNTCLAGLSAEANTATPAELKRRLGAFAYVITTLRMLRDYEGLPLHVTVDDEAGGDDTLEDRWQGAALVVLVTNAFRPPIVRRFDAASVRDGLFTVTILADRPPDAVLGGGTLERLLSGELTPVTRLETSALSIRCLDDEPMTFSLDGELLVADELDLRIRERCLSLYADIP